MKNYYMIAHVGVRDENEQTAPVVLQFNSVQTEYEFNWGGPTEEGYCYSCATFEYIESDGIILVTTENRSRSCDGPMEFYNKYIVRVDDLATDMRPTQLEPVKGAARQRDYFAESMNY